MKYIILGGNGFIGQNLCYLLVKKGCDVTCFDRETPIQKALKVSYINGDFFDDAILKPLILEHDIIVHCVSTINPGNSSKFFMNGYKNDFIQSLKICTWLENTKKRLLFLSSGGAVYGNHEEQPLSEDTLPLPINHYGNLKLSIENTLRIFALQNNIKISIARISNPYGPGQDFSKGVGFVDAVFKHALSNTPLEIWGDGMNIRDYIYIDDVCECLYKLSTYSGKELVFNIGTGIGLSQNDVVSYIKKLGLNVSVIYKEKRNIDVRSVILNNSKAKKILNFTPLSFETGISKYFEYLKK